VALNEQYPFTRRVEIQSFVRVKYEENNSSPSEISLVVTRATNRLPLE